MPYTFLFVVIVTEDFRQLGFEYHAEVCEHKYTALLGPVGD